MSPQRSFARKIVYLIIIAVLLLPIYWLSRPATGGAKPSPGGLLARLRSEHGLSQTQLGEIDPTSETLRLASLGLRGVAANLLWHKVNTYRMKKDWTNLSATLEQLIKLEPHFVTVWRYQAWNLSYNVSAEFDDYRKRYEWVIRGIDFLKKGIRYNEREPQLVWDLGWFIAQKIGRADESEQFRRLFRQDDEFHGSRPVQLRDNWLVGKEWFLRAEEMVDKHGVPLRISPVIFYSDSPMCQMNYSEYLERDGVFGEAAKNAWRKAYNEWIEYGNRNIPTSTGELIRLNEREMFDRMAREDAAELDRLAPGLRERIVAEKRNNLDPEERAVLEVPVQERTDEQHQLAFAVQRKLFVSHREVAQRVTGANRKKALELAEQAIEAEKQAEKVARYREVVNFEYWRRRAQFEQTDLALDARRFIYEGTKAFQEQADLPRAKEMFDQGLACWRALLDSDQFADLIDDAATGRELMETIQLYQRLLDARDEPMPEPFILQDIVDRYEHTVEPLSPARDSRSNTEQDRSTEPAADAASI